MSQSTELQAFVGKLSKFCEVKISAKGKEYFTGSIQMVDGNNQRQFYKCTSFRSSVIGMAKHVGAVGKENKVLDGVNVILYSTGFKLNEHSNKYELLFDKMEFTDAGWKEISDWFNDPANQQQG